MQVLPSPGLSPYIRHYLFLKTEGDCFRKLRLFSDGNTAMVFSLQHKLMADRYENLTAEVLPDAFLYGQVSEFRDLYLTREASFVIVVFHPDGMNRLLGISANEIKDQIISIEEFFGHTGLTLRDQLLHCRTSTQIVKILDKFFCHR